eukprot:Skav220242  [mRNA]  locus=scaffold3452:77822:78684:- [translate_table: standard]
MDSAQAAAQEELGMDGYEMTAVLGALRTGGQLGRIQQGELGEGRQLGRQRQGLLHRLTGRRLAPGPPRRQQSRRRPPTLPTDVARLRLFAGGKE